MVCVRNPSPYVVTLPNPKIPLENVWIIFIILAVVKMDPFFPQKSRTERHISKK